MATVHVGKPLRVSKSTHTPALSLLNLRGDPEFVRAGLSTEARLWYDRFWEAVNRDKTSDSPQYNATAVSSSDNTYNYARGMNQYMFALLSAFRATGDLQILDEIDRLAQRMRAQLFDGDCDGSNRDGFLNWRWRKNNNKYYCTDTHLMDEMMTHANVAYFAYAFHANRDLPSPGGVNYAERANFWRDYLENHFEAKWRERSGRGIDFLRRSLFHPQIQFIRYHYYMHKMTGKEEYRAYAASLTDAFMDTVRVQDKEPGGFQFVPTPMGDAALWTQRTPLMGWNDDPEQGAIAGQPWTYIRYSIAAAVDLRMEDFHRWDDTLMQGMGVALAYYVMDTDDLTLSEPFGSGTNGDAKVSSNAWRMVKNTKGRGTLARFVASSYSAPLPFMSDGEARKRVRTLTLDAYSRRESNVNRPRSPQIPSIMLTEAMTTTIE